MKMEHYLCHIDYLIWQVIQNGNGPLSVTTNTNGMIKVLPPKTVEDVVARERERKARTTLLMALPEDHLAKFHKMADAKEMWEAIKSRFGSNDESKKRHKYLLKQQFEGFSVSSSEGLHKGCDRFQTLLSQLEIHKAGVSHEDANQNFLRSLPSFWSQVALIMRTKSGLDTLSFNDLYTYLRVFERDVKGTIASSSSNSQNVTFVSTDNTSSTNDVSTVYSVSFPSVSKSQKEGSASYTNEVIHSFFTNQSSSPQLDCDDLEQIDDDDLKEMDLKWQGHFARDYRAKWNQDNRRRDGGYNGNKARDNSRRPASQDDSKDLVTIDGEAVDWSGHVEEDTQNFAMMAYSSSNSGSGNEEVLAVVEEEGRTWMIPIYEYLIEEILLEEKRKARAIHRKVGGYVVTSRVLHKKHACRSMIRGGKSSKIRVLLANYAHRRMKLIRECNSCQVHRPEPRNPQQNLTLIASLWPFYKWGIDIAETFPEGLDKVKFLIVAIDYFTKWIVAKHVATIMGAQIKKFVWDNIVCRFGLPGEIISDNKKQFRDNPFKDWCEKLCIRVHNISFKPGDLVYQNNEASHAKDGGNLGPKWERPYEVTGALGKGAYKLRDRIGNILPRTWNICNLKKCYVHEM
nr:hypothetical protein [Tanacetum cinerariifolium]